MDEHFELRAKIFIEEQGWTHLTVENGRESDQFDCDEATYILAIDPKDGVVGGLRLLPTTKPTLLSKIFPHAANIRHMPEGENVVEWTRFFVVPKWRTEGRQSLVSGILFCGVFEHLLEAEIDTVRCLAETWWLPRCISMGFEPHPLGLPLQHERWSLTAFYFSPTQSALDRLRSIHGIEGSVLASRHDDETRGDIIHA